MDVERASYFALRVSNCWHGTWKKLDVAVRFPQRWTSTSSSIASSCKPPCRHLSRESCSSLTDRRLSVICDVSCDPYGDYNPLPIYDQCTTFDRPTRRLIDGANPLDLIAIDHLPSLLPIESSEDFCAQLMPYLRQLDDLQTGVWQRALALFQQKCELARQVS